MSKAAAHEDPQCQGEITIDTPTLEQRVRDGDEDAIQVLLDIVRRVEPQTSTTLLWPSVKVLSDDLRQNGRILSSDDIDIASKICLEIAAAADFVPFLNAAVYQVPCLLDRIHLYEDDKIVIRAHLFLEGEEESYIHNHGQGMISTCLEGRYDHKIWSIDETEGGHYYTFERRPNGIYSQRSERRGGRLENVLCQPFEAGQSLFISSFAQHTVKNTGTVATLIIRDKEKRSLVSQVLSATEEPPFVDERVTLTTDADEQRRVKQKLKVALVAFRSQLIRLPGDVYQQQMADQLDTIEKNVATLSDEVDRVRGDTTQILAHLEQQRREKVDETGFQGNQSVGFIRTLFGHMGAHAQRRSSWGLADRRQGELFPEIDTERSSC